MLRISVQLVPNGDEGRTCELARADVGNISSLADVSDYLIYAYEGSNHLAGAAPWIEHGVIEGHDRRQSVWRLVERAARWAAEQSERCK